VHEYSLSMLNKDSKHLFHQMLKFINLSTNNLSDINVVYKHDATNEVIRVYLFDLPHFYSDSPETWLAPSDEIHVLQF
jgi:hypothetical protein